MVDASARSAVVGERLAEVLRGVLPDLVAEVQEEVPDLLRAQEVAAPEGRGKEALPEMQKREPKARADNAKRSETKSFSQKPTRVICNNKITGMGFEVHNKAILLRSGRPEGYLKTSAACGSSLTLPDPLLT